MATKYLLKRADELSKANSSFRIQGFTGTAVANTTTNIDFCFPGERWLTGGILNLKNAHWDDLITNIEIIDKDNVLGYGANTVLVTNGLNINVIEDAQQQLAFDCSYIAAIPQGVYFRVKYQNSHATEDVKVAVNLFTHIPRDI